MRKDYVDGFEEAFKCYMKYGEMPLYQTDYIKFKIEQLKHSNEHSEDYKNKRIKLRFCHLLPYSLFSNNIR